MLFTRGIHDPTIPFTFEGLAPPVRSFLFPAQVAPHSGTSLKYLSISST